MLTSLPDAAFTIPSLEHVARQCTHGVPSYGELRQHLGEWWIDNRPSQLAISEAAELDETARLWITYYRKREAEGFSPMSNGRPSSRTHVLSLVKQQSPAAWERLTGNSADSPKPYRHSPTPDRRRPTTDELEQVSDIAARTIADVEAKFAAVYSQDQIKPTPRHLARAELNAEYAKVGIKGPHIA